LKLLTGFLSMNSRLALPTAGITVSLSTLSRARPKSPVGRVELQPAAISSSADAAAARSK
jgi:hypothetical protein